MKKIDIESRLKTFQKREKTLALKGLFPPVSPKPVFRAGQLWSLNEEYCKGSSSDFGRFIALILFIEQDYIVYAPIGWTPQYACDEDLIIKSPEFFGTMYPVIHLSHLSNSITVIFRDCIGKIPTSALRVATSWAKRLLSGQCLDVVMDDEIESGFNREQDAANPFSEFSLFHYDLTDRVIELEKPLFSDQEIPIWDEEEENPVTSFPDSVKKWTGKSIEELLSCLNFLPSFSPYPVLLFSQKEAGSTIPLKVKAVTLKDHTGMTNSSDSLPWMDEVHFFLTQNRDSEKSRVLQWSCRTPEREKLLESSLVFFSPDGKKARPLGQGYGTTLPPRKDFTTEAILFLIFPDGEIIQLGESVEN